MVNFFDTLYTKVPIKRNFLDRIRFYSALRFSLRTMANLILPLYFKLTSKNKKYSLPICEKTSSRYIVSFTSFPARINKVWMVVETILRQTHKPDMIILWLSQEQFPTINSVPHNLLKLRERGLEIRICEGDLRSYKKFYYTLLDYPNDYFITIDDDIFYRSDMISTLFKYHKCNESAVISNYAHGTKWSEEGELLNYLNWEVNINDARVQSNLFFGSGGGTLFPPHSLYPEVLNKTVFMELCPNADDVWLNVMCRINNTSIVKTDYYSIVLPIQNNSNIKLSSTNMSTGNDIQIDAVREYCKSKFNIDPFKKL